MMAAVEEAAPSTLRRRKNNETSSHNSGGGESISASSFSDGAQSVSTSSHTSRKKSTSQAISDAEAKESARAATRLVWKESQQVVRSKVLVFMVILLVGVAGSVLTFFLVKAEERKDFAVVTLSVSKEVAATANSKAENSFGIVGSFTRDITNVAFNDGVTKFPYYTHPNFEIIAGEALRIAEVELIALVPIVKVSEIDQWNNYSQAVGMDWLLKGLDHRGIVTTAEELGPIPPLHVPDENAIPSNISDVETKFSGDSNLHFPIWQMVNAPLNPSIINTDLSNFPSYAHVANDVLKARSVLLSNAQDQSYITQLSTHNNSQSLADKDAHPFDSFFIFPIWDKFELHTRGSNPTIAAFLVTIFSWNTYFDNILTDSSNGKGINIVVADKCGSVFTYFIDGPLSKFVGIGDLHDPKYNDFALTVPFSDFATYKGSPHQRVSVTLENGTDTYVSYDERFQNTPMGHCVYTLTMYPTAGLESSTKAGNPGLYSTFVACIFGVIFAFLAFYDFMVTRRQNKLMATAQKTDAIVASLFPKEIKNRMMEEVAAGDGNNNNGGGAGGGGRGRNNKSIMTSLMADDATKSQAGGASVAASAKPGGKPIADLFPQTTIFFADIAGFTAWSSAREPTQVFTLLETIYHAFDEIAENRRVFKVETVGDCYVAVTGLPVPRKDHAVAMAKFSRDCLNRFNACVKELEVSLGPDTAELGLRVGLHSGPVTAGVLRGERSRFQLFGDTVNTASRMESNGKRDNIHVSQETADLLIEAGKSHWVEPREDQIVAKGKGQLQTYWVNPAKKANSSQEANAQDAAESKAAVEVEYASKETTKKEKSKSSVNGANPAEEVEKQQRLVNWNVECLLRFLREIESRRQKDVANQEATECRLRELETEHRDRPLDEVKEIIFLPTWQDKKCLKDSQSILLDEPVSEQLREYVSTIAAMYRKNPFHNFEHASHVVMSVIKLLSRIIAPDIPECENEKSLHDHTYGITSDPLIQFACAFSALIHDVDHSGVPNTQLIKEGSKLAAVYNNKSIAEQNSLDLAWALLMDDSFIALRRAIYRTESDFWRFRALVINSVMATDIMDKDLKNLRNSRWDAAFKEVKEEKIEIATNRKATIVIEHLIQASDVAHTMQHWHIYRKWNERFFVEMFKAYKQGRAEKNPVEFWYEGEKGFFDFYIIPLAKKLKECGVFGVSSDEYLNYAVRNRKEWESKGQEVVAAMVEKVEKTQFEPIRTQKALLHDGGSGGSTAVTATTSATSDSESGVSVVKQLSKSDLLMAKAQSDVVKQLSKSDLLAAKAQSQVEMILNERLEV